MRNFNYTTIFTILIIFLTKSHFALAQTDLPNIEKTVNLDKKPNIDYDNKALAIPKDSIKEAMDNIFNKVKIKSLMFDYKEHENIEKAIEAMRSNQSLVLEGQEEDKDSETKTKVDVAKKEEEQENAKSYIFLSSIIYIAKDNWSVWINDKKLTSYSNSKDKELYLKSVSQDSVSVIWKLSLSKWKILSGKKSELQAPKINDQNQVEVGFSLKPNQTYILSQDKVVDGRIYNSNEPKNLSQQ